MSYNVKGKISGMIEGFVAIAVLIPLVIGIYPLITGGFASLNTTFNNTFTNFLAGSSGIIGLLISVGIGYFGLMVILDLFFKKGGK